MNDQLQQRKLDFVMDHREELIGELLDKTRPGKVDELKDKIGKILDPVVIGYLPAEVAIALQIATDSALTLNFDFTEDGNAN